ncbi:hypothetical protein [Nocardia sp. BMG51109]|uniref:hypothetical protein n=1 Tax=Nocardia sp. BMG51109 TaxID=1056816 RepID=UPI000466BEDC|nr:hypothetical protein [Nocardia sp. BMG51109]
MLLIVGAVLLSRLATFVPGPGHAPHRCRVPQQADSLVALGGAKHRHAWAQVLTLVLLSIAYFMVALAVVQRFRISRSAAWSRPPPVIGAAVGFGAQRIVAGSAGRVLPDHRAAVRVR